jgi:hypothetical protein
LKNSNEKQFKFKAIIYKKIYALYPQAKQTRKRNVSEQHQAFLKGCMDYVAVLTKEGNLKKSDL